MGEAPRVCLGVVVGVKGVRGEVRIKSFTEDPAAVAAYGPVTAADGRSFKLTVVGMAQGVVIARMDGIADRNAAEALKGLELYVPRDRLPVPDTGSYYYADLVGLAAVLTGGETVGTVTSVDNFGGGDVVEVAAADGRTVLVPFAAAVSAVDLAGGRLVIDPVPGLFEEAGETGEDEKRGGDAA